MPRTTMNIEQFVLNELKKLAEKEGRPVGEVASILIAEAISYRKKTGGKRPPFKWFSAPLGLKIDILDKDALYRALDEPVE